MSAIKNVTGSRNSGQADRKKVERTNTVKITSKNMGLAGRNRALLNQVGGYPTPAADTDPQPYLATNWQRQGTKRRFTCEGRRFPTPQPMTRHLRRPNERRRAAW